MIDVTQVILAVLALIGTIITAVVVPYVRGRTTTQQQAQINNWVSIAVTAAEQIYTGSGKGLEKKAYVLAFLHEKGFTVDEAALDAMIEAAVYQLKNGFIAIEEVL